MSLFTEIEAAEKQIKETESRLNSIKDGLASIEREIVLLSLKELALNDNLKILRKNTGIVLASEFKRSKEDLNRTQTRMAMIRKDKESLEKAKAAALSFLAKSKEKLEELKASEVNNVLDFKTKSTN